MRRIISLMIAVAMFTPAFTSVAEATVANWLAPQPGEKIANRMVEVSVGYNTQSDLKVTRLELWIDSKFYSKKFLIRPEPRGVASFSWDTAKYSNGSHDLVVKIFAGDELVTEVSNTGTVGNVSYDVRPPVVAFSNVKSGDVLKGTADIKLKVSDDSGEAPLVTFLVDNMLKLLKNTPPFVYKLDTTTYTDGTHEMKTYALDSSGNKSNPAVVNVSFNNGIKQPMVASMTVTEKTAPNPDPQDEEIVRSLPPVTVPSAQDEPKASSAARADESGSKIAASTMPAGPLAKSTGPEVRSAPAATVKPKNVPAALPAAEVHRNAKPIAAAITFASAEPVEMADAHISSNATLKASVAPEAKSAKVATAVVVKSAAEPVLTSAPKTSDVKRLAIASIGSLRNDSTVALARGASAAEECASEPAVSDVKNISASSPVSGIKSSQGTRAASTKTSAQAPSAYGQKHAKPVQVAMLAGVENAGSRAAFLCPNPPKKDDKAKLEKTTVPASGTVQLRDLFERLGGIMFWDSETQTITACAYDVRIEMKIDSCIVKVNGKEMQVATAPFVANGRTFVDVSIYHQACELIRAQGLAAFAGIK